MELTASVRITDKGVDEVAQRKFKLSIKKRSVLIQLSSQKTIETLLQKTVYPLEEITEAIQNLADEGFIEIAHAAETKLAESKQDYNIAHPSAFRFVVNEIPSEPVAQNPSGIVETDNKTERKPSIVRVNSFRFVVKQ